MIKVPAKIKKILKSDRCKKNIRIVFPDHDHEDICNDKIVKNSFSFTESICSGDSLTLGIMESPVISFECVGIQNIRGKVIKIYCEILCNADDTPDAVYMADIGSYVYQIPYGVFTVSECQRQADMEHRVVTAYANAINDSLSLKSDYINTLNLPWYEDSIPVRVHISDIEKMNFFDEDMITDDASLITVPESHYLTAEGLIISVVINSYYRVGSKASPVYDQKDVTELVKQFDYYKVDGDFAEYIRRCSDVEQKIVDIYKTKVSAPLTKVEQDIRTLLGKFIYPNKKINVPTTFIREVSNYSGGSYTGGSLWGDYINGETKEETRVKSEEIITSSSGCIFNALLEEVTVKTAEKETIYYAESDNNVYIPISYQIVVSDISEGKNHTFNFNASDIITGCKTELDTESYVLKSSSYPVDRPLFRIDFSRAIKNKKKRRKQTLNARHNVTDSVKEARKEYLADLSILSEIENRDIMASYAELQGKLGRINRYGKFELVKLNGNDGLMPSTRLFPNTSLYPRGASGGTYFPINYISCWYEDLSIRKIGRINLTFNDAENNNEKASKTYDIVSDFNDAAYCTYTIGSNWILDNCSFTEEEVDEFLEVMGANLLDIQYTPCNIEMLGRPDLECGDFIQVVTNKGDVFNTIVFRRTIKGTQLLIDTIEVNATDDAESNNVGSGGSSSSTVSGGGGSSADLYYEYDIDTKTLKIIGIGKK